MPKYEDSFLHSLATDALDNLDQPDVQRKLQFLCLVTGLTTAEAIQEIQQLKERTKDE